MRSRLLWRRSATAAGLYASVALGICATIVATRVLGVERFGVFATALAAASFFQILLDLTVEDALTKLGFRYIAAAEWGKLHRLFAVTMRLKLIGGGLASLALLALAPLGEALFGGHDVGLAILAAAPLPLVQAPENVGATALLLRGRYDLRGSYQTLSQGLRFAAVAIGVHYGVVEAIVGIVIAQLISTVIVWRVGRVALARFPSAPEEPLTRDRAEIIRFVGQSSAATAMVSARTALAPLLLGVVAGPTQVGFLRVAQAPQSGFSAASSPVRLILLTEQTRDWEHGRHTDVLRGITRYMLGAGVIALVSVPDLSLGDAVADRGLLHRPVPPRRRRRQDHPRRGGDPAGARLDEVVSDDDRASGSPDRRPRRRDPRPAPAGRGARRERRRDRGRGGNPRVDARLRSDLGRVARAGARCDAGVPSARL